MLFLGTSVVSGSGLALVVATGMDTEVGHIATLIETATSGETPLQRKLDTLGLRLLWTCLAIVVVVFVLGLLRKAPVLELFLGAVSLAVAAIPEGLPAVVTIALALGVRKMARRRALVRRLPTVETLGSVQVICTDKTGTLTVGEMTARRLVTASGIFNVTGEGYSTDGAILTDATEVDAAADAMLADLLITAAACNDAQISVHDGHPSIAGDPTEVALLVAAAKGGVTRERIESGMPRLAVVPFTSDRRRMTVIRRRKENPWAFVKGAPEVIIERCTKIRTADGEAEMSAADHARMLEASAVMANDALRLLAFAHRPLDSAYASGETIGDGASVERDLTLIGLVGLQDPPRAQAREAIDRCKLAGIKTVMITGDHRETAAAIGREMGIVERGGQVLTGSELERMDDNELGGLVERVCVYARVTAEHKLRIVRAWKARGKIVAMTGDGVNDAPALKEAAIGVAMGIAGTEVAKQSADIIIADDNFASIVAASANYIYVHTTHLPWAVDTNLLPGAPIVTGTGADGLPTNGLPFQDWGAAQCVVNPALCFADPTHTILQNNQYQSIAEAVYNGGILEARKRFGQSLTLIGNYTYSKAIDDTTDFNSDYSAFDQVNLHAERAVSDFDQRHKVVFAATLQSPWNSSRWLSGFELAPIFSYNSGHPFNLLAGSDINGDGHFTNDRPPSAPRNSGLGPNYADFDMRLSRAFRFRGESSLNLTAEGFNIANRTNYASVNNIVGATFAPSFNVHGTADLSPSQPLGFTAANAKREIQLGARLTF